MRVLVALDGSPWSDAALQLVGSLAWPGGTIVQLIGVVEPAAELIAPLVVPAPTLGSFDRQTGHDFERILDDAAARLANPSLVVESRVLVGRPATLIVDRAADFRAELVIVGSRGHGRLATMLLGSVSAEVVDHSPCPVLVVRQPKVGNVLVAIDGSPSASAATLFLLGNRVLGESPIEVLTVAPFRDLPPAVLLAPISDLEAAAVEARIREERGRAEVIAAGATERLRGAGYHARWSVSSGDPAHEIPDAARSFGCNLVVVGSRGYTGLARLLLGSVARNVLLHTTASVLIVREPIRARDPELADDAEPLAGRHPVVAGAA